MKKVNKTIKFTQKASLEPYIKTNTDLRKKQQMILKKTFLSWWITQVLEKLWKMLKKYRDIKLVTTERRRNYLVSEPNYYTARFFTENLLAIEMKKLKY